MTDDDIRGNYHDSLDWREGNGVIVLRIADEPPEVLARRLIYHVLPGTGR